MIVTYAIISENIVKFSVILYYTFIMFFFFVCLFFGLWILYFTFFNVLMFCEKHAKQGKQLYFVFFLNF